jgi:hypothetical protein
LDSDEPPVPDVTGGSHDGPTAPASLLVSLSLLAVLLLSASAHATRHLNLSGDEVYFYFLAMKEKHADYRPFYQDIRDQLARIDPGALSAVQRENLDAAQFHLGIQPGYFAEFKLTRLVWGSVSRWIARNENLAESDAALARVAGDSVFFMLMAGYALVSVAVVATTLRVGPAARAALILFAVGTFFRESFLQPDLSPLAGLPGPVRTFLGTPLSGNKDFMAFGFSSRSLMLLQFAAYLACRWDALYQRKVASRSWYLLLPVLTLVHATHGVMAAGLFLVVDLAVGRDRLREPIVLLAYAGAFGFALGGGQSAKFWAFTGLAIATVALIASAGHFAGRTGASHRAGSGLAEALILAGQALAFLLLAQPAAGLLDLVGRDYWWLTVLGERFGSIFAVLVSFAVAWLLVGVARRALGERAFFSLPGTAAAAAIGPALVMIAVLATSLSVDIAAVRPRLRSHSADFIESLSRPISFEQNNELHRIWFSIIRSSIHNQSLIVELDESLRSRE